MEMNDLQVALPSTSTSESPYPKYTFKRPYRQSFSLPYPIIKYMIQNPQSAKVWKKLILSCKFFYSKYPVLPVKSLEIFEGGCAADGKIFDSTKPFPKLWVYDSFSAFSGSDMSCLIHKSIIFDVRDLKIFHQKLTMDDYRMLTSSGSVEKIHLLYSKIINAESSGVTFDEFFENLQHVEEFGISFSNTMLKADTVKKMVKHLNGFKNMRALTIYGFKESFDFASFADFLMKNETVDIYLSFRGVLPEYKEMVQNVINEIKKNASLKIPIIYFWE